MSWRRLHAAAYRARMPMWDNARTRAAARCARGVHSSERRDSCDCEMIGRLRSKALLWTLRGVDWYGRRIVRHQDRRPAPELWEMRGGGDGHLEIRGCDATELAQRFGTPLHVVDRARLEGNYRGFLESFRAHWPRVEIGYSYKTNPLPGVLRVLHDLGAAAEVISHFELWLALRLGVPPERIIFNGPGKTADSLALAVERGIRLINIDGAGEIPDIERLAREAGRVQQVGIRLVTSVGWSGQFGIPLRSGAAMAAARAIRDCPHLELCGLHVHLGTGIKNVQTYVQAVRELLDFGAAVAKETGARIRYLDFGGGFGVPTVAPITSLDRRLLANGMPAWTPEFSRPAPFAEYGRALGALVREYHPSGAEDAPLVLLEPGRAITSSAQSLLLRVLAIKPGERGTETVILDGGRNIVMPPSWEHHAVLPASRMNAAPAAWYNLYGPLCHPGDLLFRGCWLPRLEVGDLLAVMDSGAYFIPNQMNFSNPRPAVVMVEDGAARVIRERESFEDIVARDTVEAPAPRAGVAAVARESGA